jgi:hypothetical protein
MQLSTIAVKLAFILWLVSVLQSNESSHVNAESNSPRATVLIFGRTVCSDRQRQFLAIQTQRQSLFKALSKRGFEVNGILATNDCGQIASGTSWEEELRSRYGSAVHSFVLDNCTGFLEDRCLLNVRTPAIVRINSFGVSYFHNFTRLFYCNSCL